MAASSPWPIIHAERRALADDLQQLTDEQWATPSLCRGWSVHQVLGHMTATTKKSPPRFLAGMVSTGFRFTVLSDRDVAKETAGGPQQTLAEFRRHADSTVHPPGPVDSWLGETIVHGEDIRRPLGLRHRYPLDAVTRVADFYRRSNVLIGGKRRVTGLRLQATDADWSTGSGPLVRGPALSLLLAMTGRHAVLDELSGDGLEELRSRA